MPEQAFDDMFQDGVRVSRVARTISDAEIERRGARDVLRQRLALLRVWSSDAKTEAELSAMTAAQRLARQAVIEDRFAKLARAVLYLTWQVGEDDGS